MKRVFFLTMLVGALALVPGMAGADEAACPENLSHLTEEMEALLQGVHVKEFKRSIRSALQASIPQAIEQADGIHAQIVFLRKEIQHQLRVEKSAALIARDVSKNPHNPLEPCERPEETGYCHTVERYFMAKASNLANRGFLEALECYQRHGYH